jgi:hypothetical protein
LNNDLHNFYKKYNIKSGAIQIDLDIIVHGARDFDVKDGGVV